MLLSNWELCSWAGLGWAGLAGLGWAGLDMSNYFRDCVLDV